ETSAAGLVPISTADDKDEVDELWLAKVRGWQKLLADGGSLLERTRVDSAAFDYDDKGMVVVYFDGCHLGEARGRGALARKLVEVTRGTFPQGTPRYRAALPARFIRPSPVVALQRHVGRKNDGLLFHRARYDGQGILLLNVLLGGAGQKTAAEQILADHPIA